MSISELIMQDLPGVILLVVGFALLVIEMYIPGFGVAGVSGTVCLIAGVALWSESFAQGLVLTVIIIALLSIALAISIHSLSKGRLAKSKLVLQEAAISPGISENDLSYFVGREGVARTVLRPAGIGEFHGVKLNVVTDGSFIPAGAKVRVERVEGNRIVVTQA